MMTNLMFALFGSLALFSSTTRDVAEEPRLSLNPGWPTQQIFLSDEPTQLTIQVTARQGTFVVYTRDEKGARNDLGQASPDKPFKGKGTYTELFVRRADGVETAVGSFKLSFEATREE